eukprot:GHVQ01017039.1.p1 GENE.GHVQ01017039.1~~GHVQ01017039.1.p1  ORF type:complete len:125 (+),score=28.08 GHVQ01017039.1:389-763(+)
MALCVAHISRLSVSVWGVCVYCILCCIWYREGIGAVGWGDGKRGLIEDRGGEIERIIVVYDNKVRGRVNDRGDNKQYEREEEREEERGNNINKYYVGRSTIRNHIHSTERNPLADVKRTKRIAM